jgi:NNP family nitrate/nitrite transporter-like MFS transporter
VGGYRLLVWLLGAAALCMAFVSSMPPVAVAVLVLGVAMGLLGMGNGAVFQLVPQRFPERIGLVTGIVGAAGGLGGFFLPTVLGAVKDATGQYTAGLLGVAVVFLVGTVVLLELGAVWLGRWPATAVNRTGVFAYRGALEPVVDDPAA